MRGDMGSMGTSPGRGSFRCTVTLDGNVHVAGLAANDLAAVEADMHASSRRPGAVLTTITEPVRLLPLDASPFW